LPPARVPSCPSARGARVPTPLRARNFALSPLMKLSKKQREELIARGANLRRTITEAQVRAHIIKIAGEEKEDQTRAFLDENPADLKLIYELAKQYRWFNDVTPRAAALHAVNRWWAESGRGDTRFDTTRSDPRPRKPRKRAAAPKVAAAPPPRAEPPAPPPPAPAPETPEERLRRIRRPAINSLPPEEREARWALLAERDKKFPGGAAQILEMMEEADRRHYEQFAPGRRARA